MTDRAKEAAIELGSKHYVYRVTDRETVETVTRVFRRHMAAETAALKQQLADFQKNKTIRDSQVNKLVRMLGERERQVEAMREALKRSHHLLVFRAEQLEAYRERHASQTWREVAELVASALSSPTVKECLTTEAPAPPMTAAEADAAYDDAPADPMSDEEIERLIKTVTSPAPPMGESNEDDLMQIRAKIEDALPYTPDYRAYPLLHQCLEIIKAALSGAAEGEGE